MNRICIVSQFCYFMKEQWSDIALCINNFIIYFDCYSFFSILGMNLFGCRFCEIQPDGTKLCDRKNFDSLLWAIVTVFQV
jgi:hypothetical protein